MQVTFIFSLIFAVLVAVFAVLNPGTVTINVLFAKFQTSQAVVILFSAFLGAILVYLLDLVKKIKSGLKNKDNEKKVKSLTEETEKLTKEVENYKSQNVDLMDENNELLEAMKNLKSELASKELADESETETKVDITK